MQLTPDSPAQSIRGTVLAAVPVPQRWRPALLGAAEPPLRWTTERSTVTLFEYVTVAVSVVVSLCVVRLLDGLRFAAARERRYWVHLLWVVTKLLNCALYWWGLWATRESASWNFASFMWVLLFPGTLYLQCTALVTTAPAAVAGWRDHFYSVRRWFFAINLVLIAHVLLTSAVLLGVPLLHGSRVPMAVVFLLNVLGVLSANPRLHGALVVVALLTNVVGFGAVWFQPGAAV